MNWADISELVPVIIAGCGVCVACEGLETWRKQLKGTSEYQLAKDTLKAVYRAQETFRFVRHELFIDQRESDKDEVLVREYEKLNAEVRRAYGLLNEKCLAARIEWGKEFQKVPACLEGCFLVYSVEAFYVTVFGPSNSDKDESRRKEILEGKNDEDGENPFTERINEGVADFEKFLRPKIDKKSSSVFNQLCRPSGL